MRPDASRDASRDAQEAGQDVADAPDVARDVDGSDAADAGSDTADVSIDVETDVVVDAGGPTLVAQFDCDTAPMMLDLLPDITGNGHDARCEVGGCPTLSPGRPGMGTACDFSATERLRISNHPDFAGTDGFTVTAWINPDRGGSMSVFGKPVGPTNCNSWQIFLYGSAPRIRFVSAERPAIDIGHHDILVGPDILLGIWRHVAVVYDGTTKRLYIGGEEVASSDPPGILFEDRDIFIGADENIDVDGGAAFALPYDGQVDDLRYYDRALTALEVRSVFDEFP